MNYLRIFENFKTTFGYYLSNFYIHTSFQSNFSMFSFYTRVQKYRRDKIGPKKHSGTSLFLVKILKNFLYIFRMTNKFTGFYQSKGERRGYRSGVRGISVSKMEEVGLVFYTVPYSIYCKRASVYLYSSQ